MCSSRSKTSCCHLIQLVVHQTLMQLMPKLTQMTLQWRLSEREHETQKCTLHDKPYILHLLSLWVLTCALCPPPSPPLSDCFLWPISLGGLLTFPCCSNSSWWVPSSTSSFNKSRALEPLACDHYRRERGSLTRQLQGVIGLVMLLGMCVLGGSKALVMWASSILPVSYLYEYKLSAAR